MAFKKRCILSLLLLIKFRRFDISHQLGPYGIESRSVTYSVEGFALIHKLQQAHRIEIVPLIMAAFYAADKDWIIIICAVYRVIVAFCGLGRLAEAVDRFFAVIQAAVKLRHSLVYMPEGAAVGRCMTLVKNSAVNLQRCLRKTELFFYAQRHPHKAV